MPLVTQDLYRFDDFELQPSARALLRSGEKLPLTPKTFEVLVCLVANAGRVVHKEELLRAVWPDSHVEQSNLTQHIFWLRKVLTDRANYITTIPGRGYQFTGRVTTVSESLQHQEQLFESMQAHPDVYQLRRVHERTHISVHETLASEFPHEASSHGHVVEAATAEAAAATAGVADSRRYLWYVMPVAAILLVLAAVGLWRYRHRRLPADYHEIVLADFQNSTGDPSFDHALTTLLAINLNQSPYLVVAGANDVRQILQLMNHAPDSPLTPLVAREVCQRMNDQVVLDGTIANFGRKYLVTLTATGCSNGNDLVQTKAVANDREDVLRAVDAVAADMRSRLGEPLQASSGAFQPLQRAHTFSLDALKMYSQAHDLELAVRYQEAFPLYQRAVELDPRFAAAYLGLAHCYGRFGEDTLSRQAITTAYGLRDEVDDLLRLDIVNYYNAKVTGDAFAILRNLQSWTDMYPLQASPWANLAAIQHSIGRADLAIEPARHSLALDPNNGYAYEVLAGSLLNNGQVDEALAACNEAIRRHVDGRDIHVLLYHIAALQHNAGAMATEVAWARGRDSEPQMTDEQAYYAFSQGRAREGIALWMHMVQMYRDQGLEERADRMLSGLPRREAQVGLVEPARALLHSFHRPASPINVAIPLAQVGEIDKAEAMMEHPAGVAATDTLQQNVAIPQIRAAILIARQRPLEAIAMLEPALAYDLSGAETMELRAQAYFAAGQLQNAADQYRKIIDHAFISPLSACIPLAHLGLARVLRLQGNVAASRHEYDAFFALWKDADSDLPPLVEAHQEYAQLR